MSGSKKWMGHLMIIFTQIMLGVNIPITRDLLLNYLSPIGYIGIRAGVAALFFWGIQFFAKKRKYCQKRFRYDPSWRIFGVCFLPIFNLLEFAIYDTGVFFINSGFVTGGCYAFAGDLLRGKKSPLAKH